MLNARSQRYLYMYSYRPVHRYGHMCPDDSLHVLMCVWVFVIACAVHVWRHLCVCVMTSVAILAQDLGSTIIITRFFLKKACPVEVESGSGSTGVSVASPFGLSAL